MDVADGRPVHVGQFGQGLGVPAVVRAIDGTAHRRDTGRHQLARVDQPFVTQRIEFILTPPDRRSGYRCLYQ